jgi:hypothetical protein
MAENFETVRRALKLAPSVEQGVRTSSPTPRCLCGTHVALHWHRINSSPCGRWARVSGRSYRHKGDWPQHSMLLTGSMHTLPMPS